MEHTGARGNADQPCDYARAKANCRKLPLQAVIQQTPSDAPHASSQVSDHGGHDTAQVGSEGGAGVEAEPADPEEDGARHDVGRIVRTVVELVCPVASALSKHHGIGQGSAARGDMHGGATGKVQHTHLVRPSIRVPSPTGDGVVDNSGPNKDEDDAWEHAATLGDGAGSKGDGHGGEHALVDGEEHIRDVSGAHRGPGQDIFETKVGQVTDEGARRVRKGEREAPEEPLEACYRCAHY